MDIDEEIIEKNGERFFTMKGCLVIMLYAYLFPDIRVYEAYWNCKQKTEYLAFLLATRKYCKNKGEAMKEINSIRTVAELLEYVDKIYEKFLTGNDIIDILYY